MTASETGTRRRAGEWILVAVVASAFALAFSHRLLRHFGSPHDSESALDDWDLFTSLQWIPWVEVTRDGQLPLWDPYRCSGIPLWGYAESRFLSPFFLLSLAFGPFVGIDLEIILHLALMWAGGYVLGRVLGFEPLASAACASVFPASSWFGLHVAQGHLTYLPFAYAPWVVACDVVAVERRRVWPAAVGGLLSALVLGGGGLAHVFVYVVPLVVVLALVAAVVARDPWPLVAVAMTVGCALVLGAVKLLPVLAYAGARLVDDTDAVTLTMFGRMLFGRDQDLLHGIVGGGWGFWEYGAYVGVLFGVLAVMGVVTAPRRALPWVVAAAAMLALAAGHHGAWAPWTLLHALPVFDSLRVPSRWVIVAVLAVAPLVGLGVQWLARGGGVGRVVAAVVLVLAVVDCWLVGAPNLKYVPLGPSIELPPSDRFRQYWDENDRTVLRLGLANLGALNCVNELVTGPRPGAARGMNEPGYRGEEYLLGDGTVSLVRWTTNVLEYDVAAPAPTTLVVNQRFDAGWRVQQGSGEPSDEGGLLAVRVPAGTQRLALRYRSEALVVGSVISLAGLIALVAVVRRRW